MSGAAGLSAAKRRRAGSDYTSNMSRDNSGGRGMGRQQSQAPPPAPKHPNDIFAIHDRILPEIIQRTNTVASNVSEIQAVLTKIGENEKNLHNRLQKLESLFNDLAKEVNSGGSGGQTSVLPVDVNKIRKEAEHKAREEAENANRLVKQQQDAELQARHKQLETQMQSHMQSQVQTQVQQAQQQAQQHAQQQVRHAQQEAEEAQLKAKQQQEQAEQMQRALEEAQQQLSLIHI